MGKKEIFNWIMVFGILLILAAGCIAWEEFHKAKVFCNSINGNYNLTFTPLPPVHRCNNKVIIQYSDGWDFIRQDINNITIKYP